MYGISHDRASTRLPRSPPPVLDSSTSFPRGEQFGLLNIEWSDIISFYIFEHRIAKCLSHVKYVEHRIVECSRVLYFVTQWVTEVNFGLLKVSFF
jgi:hypothetical protein